MPIAYRSDLPASADMVVIGGGVVGAASAFFAARAGRSPLLVEARPALATLTTPASTGAYRLQFDNREELELVRRSVEVFSSFEEVTGQKEYSLGLRRQGYLWLTTEEEGMARQRRIVDRQRSWGLEDVEILEGARVRERFPYVAGSVRQARFRAGDGFLDPKALALGLVAGCGADVITSCRVDGLVLEGNRVKGLRTSRGEVSTGTVVIAAGPFSGRIAEQAGVSLPISTVTRHKVVVPEAPAVPPDAPMTIDEETGAHWRPALRGAFLLHTDPATPPTPPAEGLPIDHEFAFRLLDPASPVSVARVVPFWGDLWRRGDLHWMLQAGQYVMTPDHRPLIGLTEIEGLYVNAGYSGHGIMASVAGSEHLAEVMHGSLEERRNPFRLDRVFEARERDVL